jgi:hypothetical protein
LERTAEPSNGQSIHQLLFQSVEDMQRLISIPVDIILSNNTLSAGHSLLKFSPAGASKSQPALLMGESSMRLQEQL